ncbi:MAG: MotA/TolQ/ExbB proton channel family protein [Planctomycetota bacterium]
MKGKVIILASLLAIVALCLFSPAVVAQEGGAKAPAGGSTTLGDIFKNAGIIGWLIVLLSVVGMGLVIEHFITVRRDKLAPPELIDEVEALLEEKEYQEALELCESEPNYFTNVVAAGLPKISASFEAMEKSIEEAGEEEAVRLHQKISWLSLIANVAPMMGLLGTVAGMIEAFNVIAAQQGQASPADLAGGISGALITTMFGLIVAIPITAFFFFFRNRVVKTVIEVGAIVEDLFERFRPRSESHAPNA